MDMRRPPIVHPVAPGIGAGFHGAKVIIAVLIGHGAATATKVGIDWRQIGVFLMAIPTARIGLPDLDQRVWYWTGVFVQNPAMHDDALTDGALVWLGIVGQQIVVDRCHVAVAKAGAGDFAGGVFQADQRQLGRARHRGLVILVIGRGMPAAVALVELALFLWCLGHCGFPPQALAAAASASISA